MAHLHSMHTHTCGELRAANVGQEVKLTGWVDRRRDLGQLIFVTIRDREGMTQVIFDPDLSGEAFQTAETIRPEWPILVSGTVRHRIEGQTNEHMATGEIEVLATGITVLNTSVTPPFPIDDSTDTAEDIRLRYRYLDLRRPVMNKNLRLRSDFTFALREAFHANAFTEVEINLLNGCINALFGGDKEICREDCNLVKRVKTLSTDGVNELYGVNLVVKKGYTIAVIAKGGHNIYRVTLHAERGGR